MLLFRNLHVHACQGIIISWADLGQGGHGHVNNHSPAYVRAALTDLGYHLDVRLTNKLRVAQEPLVRQGYQGPISVLRKLARPAYCGPMRP